MAQDAGVALGTVAIVMKELRRAGYLVPAARHELRLERREELLDLFVKGYALKLRPACFIERYRHEQQDVEALLRRVRDRLRHAKQPWAVTGGVAANRLTQFLEPDVLTVFVPAQAADVLRDERMLVDPTHGNLILLKHFAPTIEENQPAADVPLATPLLVYAELLFDGRPREAETAGLVREGFLMKDQKP
jgi:hypothetical protein